ncbi:hypothetical protein CI109_104211 [Kwoniella shandongensis]|uniref:Uncharacterized protein n=1 Tax=Kwoniella shandongensis TaxID=1734106 RepID=A0AAJ8LL48_9TREE
MSGKKKDEKRFQFGPFEQIIFVLLVMGFALSKAKSSSSSSSSSSSRSSSSSSKPDFSSDVRAGAMSSSSSSKRVGDPTPKHVSGGSSRDDPSSTSFRKNYFLTMQGPGRPALVPFQDGLRPKAGEAADATDMMTPPIDKDKLKASVKNPWIREMFEKDIQLLKIAKQSKEEEERYSKVTNMLQTMLGFLLCAVDMRLGAVSLVFFLWRHYTKLHDDAMSNEKDEVKRMKKDLEKQLAEAKKSGMSSSERQGLQMALERL